MATRNTALLRSAVLRVAMHDGMRQQHGAAPQGYPLSRMLADVVDLGAATELGAREVGWLRTELSEAELTAVLGLARALARGEDLGALDPGSPPALLLRHFLAGVLDARYRDSLKLAFLLRPLPARGRFGALAHQLRTVALPNRTQLELIYGPARSTRELWARRLLRPLDLSRRLGRYAWSTLRVKLDR
jgi:hypothetical protein